MQPAMATPQNKRPASLFSKLRTLTRLTRTSAKVAPAGLAAALETAGAEALELLPATLHTNDAAAAKRWARRVTERQDRPRAKTFEEDEVRKLPTSPTHWGRTTSDAQDDIVLVSPDFSMTKSRFEVPDLHLGRLSPMKPSLMSPLGSTTRFSARLTQRTQRGSARSTTRYNDGSTHRLATARSKAEVVSSSNFAAFAALDGEGACLACMNDAAWRRRVCAPPLDSKSLEVLRATCAALRGDEEDDAAFAFEAFCAAVSARAPVDDAVALATRTGDTLMYATDRLRALDPDAVKERALLCAFLKAADVNAAQLACEVLRSGRGRRSVPVCRAALELVESIDEETALALTRHVDACLADDDAEAVQALRALRHLLSQSPVLVRYVLRATKGPLAFAADRLDRPGARESAYVALRAATYALMVGCDADVRHVASSLVPIHAEALKTSFKKCHLEALLVVAARCDFRDTVDAFRYCGVVPLLVALLAPSTGMVSEPATPFRAIPDFNVGDVVLALGEAKNGRERWFRATIKRVGTHSYDITWASGGAEAIPKEKVRAPKSTRDPPLQAPRILKPAPCRSPRLPNTPDEEPWCLDVPQHGEQRTSREGLRIDVSAARRSADGESDSLSSIVGGTHVPRSPNRRSEDIPAAVADDATHGLVLALLLVLAVGRASDGGELEPAFCTATPLASTGPQLALNRSSSNLSASALLLSGRFAKDEGPVTGRRTLTARSLSARSALVSARSTPDDLSASLRSGKGLLDVGTEGDALTFHVLDCLHQHLNDPRRVSNVEKVLPSVLKRLGAWGAAMASPGRSDGAKRLLKLLHEGATPALFRQALVAEQRGAFVGRGRFGSVVAIDDDVCAKILRRERSNRDRSVCHAVYGEVSALWLLRGTRAAPELLDFGLSRDCYVLIIERCQGTLATWRDSYEVLDDALCSEVLGVFAKTCRAVSAMHATHVIHLDLKAENVLLRHDGTVCLGDFGEARILGPDRDGVRLSKAHGTECVQAPEILNGVQQGADVAALIDTKADCWALGCLLYELLAGAKLFEAMAQSDWPRFFVLLTGDGDLPPPDMVRPFAHLERCADLLGVFRGAFVRDASKRAAAGDLAELADACAV